MGLILVGLGVSGAVTGWCLWVAFRRPAAWQHAPVAAPEWLWRSINVLVAWVGVTLLLCYFGGISLMEWWAAR